MLICFQRDKMRLMDTFVDFAEIMTVGDAVEHALRIAAIRVEFGAESDGVRNDARVLARNGTGFLREDGDPSLGDPRFLREFLVLTQTLIVRG